jgi:hypothetical protein
MTGQRGVNRRDVLRLAGAAGLVSVGGTGIGSALEEPIAEEPSGSLLLDNGTYSVVVGPASSDDWVFGASDDVFHEEFAVSAGGGPGVWASDGIVLDGFPASGEPGTEYAATVGIPLGEIPVTVERRVVLDPTDPLLKIRYRATNEWSEPLDDVRLFQYVDYDTDDDTDDNGDYVPDPEYVYQYDPESGQTVGFTGSRTSERHDLTEPYTAPEDAVEGGTLENRDWDDRGVDDLGAALQWNLGTLAPGETSDALTVGFAAGDSRAAVRSLLSDVGGPFPDPVQVSGRGDESGDGGEESPTETERIPVSFPEEGVTDEFIGPPEDPDDDGLYEDVNGDGQVDRADYDALRRILRAHEAATASNPVLTREQELALDFNGDGRFDYGDVQFFLRRYTFQWGGGGGGGEETDGGETGVWRDGR